MKRFRVLSGDYRNFRIGQPRIYVTVKGNDDYVSHGSTGPAHNEAPCVDGIRTKDRPETHDFWSGGDSAFTRASGKRVATISKSMAAPTLPRQTHVCPRSL